MNNDISRDIKTYNKIPVSQGKMETSKMQENTSLIEDTRQPLQAMECLGAMGCAQVNMRKGNSVKKSVDEYMQDPFAADAQISFQDNLMKDNNYDIWQAMEISDKFFQGLKEEDTYNRH